MKKTAEAKRYQAWLHQKPCCVCGRVGIEAHHLTHKSLSPRRDDLRMIPLCSEHHRGNNGIHTLGLKWYDRFITLAQCKELASQLYKEFKDNART